MGVDTSRGASGSTARTAAGTAAALRLRLDPAADFLRRQRDVEQVGELGRQVVRCEH